MRRAYARGTAVRVTFAGTVAALVAQFERSGIRLDPDLVRSDLGILRREAEKWRDFLVERSLKWWRTIPQA